MTETSKVRSWAYPTKIGANDVTDPQQYYKALAAAKDGYFPLGKNGLWHGGIHLDDASGLVADQSEVRCIADGEVVAYRIDEQYPTSQYGDKSAVYSTGFVLVKHRMEVPVPPTPATAPGTPAPGAPAPAAATPSPSLTFYSRPAFVSKSKQAASALPADQKTLVEIHASTKVIQHQAGFTKDNPPQISMAGEVTGYNQIIPLSVLESLPAEKKIKIEMPQQGGSSTVVSWWHLEGVLGGTNNQVLNGWVREQDLIRTRLNPWEWEGFVFLEETSTNLQNWASYLHDQDSLADAEKSVHKPAPTRPVKERLYNIIDTEKNDKLTVAEIVAALGKPWHAQSISQLVVKYESEWLYKVDKWSALDQYMGSPNPSWDAEKARIEKLAWWGDLAGKYGVSVDGLAWHIHSIALTHNNKRDIVG